ncbi:MAG: GNAT family N-acetyltransferase [Bacteroidia bacterium]|nr:GNAT family N-acetyltransferase [Bacteroidia bacterium]
MDIQHQQSGSKGSFYIQENKEILAEMTYSRAGEKLIIIDHTEVSDQLRGQGAGKKLVTAMVEWARTNDMKVMPLCPFANAIFKRDSSIQDVLK